MAGRRFWTEGAGSFAIAIAVALFIRWALFEAYVIPSSSMVPTLLVHDHIFVNKIAYGLRIPFTEKWFFRLGDPERGDVVVFRHLGESAQTFIKRVVAVPGDRVYYENGNLYVNDSLVDKTVPLDMADDWQWVMDEDFPGEVSQGGKENYTHWEENLDRHSYSILLRKGSSPRAAFGPVTVPTRHFFVMGDNRDNSQDSRDWDPEPTRARGKITLSRKVPGEKFQLEAGTLVKSASNGAWPQKFRLMNSVVLAERPVTADVEAIEAGPLGNIAPHSLGEIEFASVDAVQVDNEMAFQGGADRRFVARDLLVGRATRVWLSCEKMLPVFNFLCHPFRIRWNRFFHPIK